MQGKRVLITGGNSGIGLITSIELAKMGAELVLACRDSEKTTQALAAINATAKVEAVNLPVNLANLRSVRDLAAGFLSKYDRLDVLINNAGTFPSKQRFTDDGLEMQIGVNHIAHFLLTNLLLDCLKSSAPARIITVTSMLHKNGTIDFDSFKGFEKYSAQKAYNQSKLANVLFAVELAQRLEGTGVTSNTLHPGAVNTGILDGYSKFAQFFLRRMFITAEKGARTSLYLAGLTPGEMPTGKYLVNSKEAPAHKLLEDAALRERLWDTCNGFLS